MNQPAPPPPPVDSQAIPASTGQHDSLFSELGPPTRILSAEEARSVTGRPVAAASRRGNFASLPWVALQRVAGVLRYLVRRWIRHHPGLVSRVLETALWPALFVGLAWYSNPANPFYIDEGFPWPWLGPWLIGLRYGVAYGAAASVGLWGSWLIYTQTVAHALVQAQQFPRLYFLGGAIATLIAGEFGSHWRMQILRLQEGQQFLNDKVERLTRRLYLIKLSHDELEYEMVDRPGTLRESLIELRILMDRYTRENPLQPGGLPGAQFMLDFVAQHCRIDSAIMYSVRMEPTIKLTRVAAVGAMPEPDADDPMILRALESGHQMHLQDALLERSERHQLIAATPLISSAREPFGLVAIGNMPFTSLTTDNLQTIAVLLESYADYLRLSLNAAEILPQWPLSPRGLAGEFAWLNRLSAEFGLASRCMVWRIRHAREPEMLDYLQQLHSRGETAWRWPVGSAVQRSKPCVIVLVPFTDAAGANIYKQRIFDGMGQSFGGLSADQLNAFDFSLGNDRGFTRLRLLVEGGQ